MEELEYEGSNFLRLRLVLSVLSGRSVRINRIRWKEDNPGLRESEASLIRLMDKLTNGSKFTVSQTGTQLTFQVLTALTQAYFWGEHFATQSYDFSVHD